MMKPTQMSHAAPGWLRELATARADYEELLGWPVDLHVTDRRLTIPAGRLFDAVSMPAALGTSVQRQLGTMLLDGPVIARLRPRWLTFLTGLSASAEPLLPVDLDRTGVRLVMRGDIVVLPTARGVSDAGEVHWFSPPRPRRTPPAWSVVIGVSRRIVSCPGFDQSSPLPPRQRAA